MTEPMDRADLLGDLDDAAEVGYFGDEALIDIDVDLLSGVRPSQLVDWLVERYELTRRSEPAQPAASAAPTSGQPDR